MDGLIEPQKLKRLYLEKKLNAYQIAKLYGCGHSTVYRRLQQFGIARRNISDAHIRYAKQSFSSNSIEKAYLIGFRLGDLWVHKLTSGQSQTIRVDCHSTKPEQIKLFKTLFERYSKVIVTQHRFGTGIAGHLKDTWKARVYLDLSFSFLLPKQDSAEEWIISDEKYFWAFFAGYADAEGCFAINKSNNRPGFHIQSYDKNILFQMHDKLRQLNISAPLPLAFKSVKYTGSKDNCIWSLSIFRKHSLKLLIINLRPYLKHAKRKKDMGRIWELVGNG